MDDGALIKRIREGDEDAFAIFVDRHKDSLVNYLTHLTRSRERAEEVAQDAFVRFYRNASKCRDRRWKSLLPRLIALQPRSAPPADRPLLTEEIQRKVTEALEQLPLKFRA